MLNPLIRFTSGLLSWEGPVPDLWEDRDCPLEPGQMIIWEQALASLEDNLEHLIDRAKYHDACPHTKEEYVEMLQSLADRAKQIRRSNQGEA